MIYLRCSRPCSRPSAGSSWCFGGSLGEASNSTAASSSCVWVVPSASYAAPRRGEQLRGGLELHDLKTTEDEEASRGGESRRTRSRRPREAVNRGSRRAGGLARQRIEAKEAELEARRWELLGKQRVAGGSRGGGSRLGAITTSRRRESSSRTYDEPWISRHGELLQVRGEARRHGPAASSCAEPQGRAEQRCGPATTTSRRVVELARASSSSSAR
nr:unnamed protein product [Digitaria exilis]